MTGRHSEESVRQHSADENDTQPDEGNEQHQTDPTNRRSPTRRKRARTAGGARSHENDGEEDN